MSINRYAIFLALYLTPPPYLTSVNYDKGLQVISFLECLTTLLSTPLCLGHNVPLFVLLSASVALA